MEHKLFFLKLFGHRRDIRAKSRDIPPKKFGFPGFLSKDKPNFLAPTPSRGRPPPHPKISGLESLDLGSFFFPDLCFPKWYVFYAKAGICRNQRKSARICIWARLSGPLRLRVQSRSRTRLRIAASIYRVFVSYLF